METHHARPRILIVRLGAMGDILHALPAVASLKHSFPQARLTWIVEPRWASLLEGNPYVDRIATLRRGSVIGLFDSWRALRSEGYDVAVDFQGLLKSALVASSAHPERIYGFHQSLIRERAAALFYSNKVINHSAHVVDRNLALAAAAGAGRILRTFSIPAGKAEGELPDGDFVLASPLAGWRSKQWPMGSYGVLAARLRRELGIPLVLNGPPDTSFPMAGEALRHSSGLAGLIHATRGAAAVLGVDSGPLHLAAALNKPGVAIFGPTDPARNGPYGESIQVLRSPSATTTYKRGDSIHPSMQAISPDEVFEALKLALGKRRHPAGCMV